MQSAEFKMGTLTSQIASFKKSMEMNSHMAMMAEKALTRVGEEVKEKLKLNRKKGEKGMEKFMNYMKIKKVEPVKLHKSKGKA